MKRYLIASLAILAVVALSPAADAAIILNGCGADDLCTLDELLAGGSIQIEDKLFDNFDDYSATAMGGATPILASDITVIPVIDGLEEGLLFQTFMFVSAGETLDTRFTFQVSTVSGNALIDDDLLEVTGGVNGTGVLFVDEVVRDENNVDVAQASLFVFQTPQTNFTLDVGQFDPQDILLVSKDIALAGGEDGSASISDFTQMFSQIPEPSSLLLLGAALAGLGFVRLRRNR